MQDMAGSRGDVWVVGAQNAGKSSLINAMQRLAGLKGSQQITTAAQPGTTLGDSPQACSTSWSSSEHVFAMHITSKIGTQMLQLRWEAHAEVAAEAA